MKTSEAFWQFLPEGLDELFDMVRFEKTDHSYDIWLDEKKKLSDDDYRNPNIVARGSTSGEHDQGRAADETAQPEYDSYKSLSQ